MCPHSLYFGLIKQSPYKYCGVNVYVVWVHGPLRVISGCTEANRLPGFQLSGSGVCKGPLGLDIGLPRPPKVGRIMAQCL